MFYLIPKRMKKLIKANKVNRLSRRKQSTEKIKAKIGESREKKLLKGNQKSFIASVDLKTYIIRGILLTF